MTRTDVTAASRARSADAASMRSRSPRRRHVLLLPVLLVIAAALATPGVALGAGESTSGYSQKPEEPKSGTQPSKESEPAKEKTTTTTPTTTTPTTTTSTAPSHEKAATLPFTGFDLRWSIAVGLLLMGTGLSIVVVQRRRGQQRR
jgi:hypothetical protein